MHTHFGEAVASMHAGMFPPAPYALTCGCVAERHCFIVTEVFATPSSTSMRQTRVDTREPNHCFRYLVHAVTTAFIACFIINLALNVLCCHEFFAYCSRKALFSSSALADAVIDLDAVNPIVAASVAGRFAVVSLLRCREIFVGFSHSGALFH